MAGTVLAVRDIVGRKQTLVCRGERDISQFFIGISIHLPAEVRVVKGNLRCGGVWVSKEAGGQGRLSSSET